MTTDKAPIGVTVHVQDSESAIYEQAKAAKVRDDAHREWHRQMRSYKLSKSASCLRALRRTVEADATKLQISPTTIIDMPVHHLQRTLLSVKSLSLNSRKEPPTLDS